MIEKRRQVTGYTGLLRMPTITLDRKRFEKYAGKKLPLEKLKDRISYLGTDLDEITDKEITVEVFPNRPDMLSVQGFARAFSSFVGNKTGLAQYEVTSSGEKVIIDKSVSKIRPYTACAIVKGITYDDAKIKEVIQIQEKLHITFGRHRKKAAIGIYPFEHIKPPIRFIAKKPKDIRFRPLESPKEMDGAQILAQHPTGKEYGHLLEGLPMYPIFVDSTDKILSMPPIINSHELGKISEDTRDVFIECSGFDFNVLRKCLNMIVCALADMGGQVCSMQLVYPDKTYTTPDLKPDSIKVDIGYINRLLGLSLKEKEFSQLLEKMGLSYDEKKKTALIPAYRADIMHQADIAEDIAIAYGFDNFTPEIPRCATIGQEDKLEVFKSKIAELLVGLGYLEINTYNLSNSVNQTARMNSDIKLIQLANSLSREYDALRAWVIPSVMEVFETNKHHDYPQKLFGMGTVFKKDAKQDTGIFENERIAIGISGDKADYTEIRQVLDMLMRNLNIEFSVAQADHDSFITGRVGRVRAVNAKKSAVIAYVGEISPQVLENWGLNMPVACLEINLTELFELISDRF